MPFEVASLRRTIQTTLDPLLKSLSRDFLDDADLSERIKKLFEASRRHNIYIYTRGDQRCYLHAHPSTHTHPYPLTHQPTTRTHPLIHPPTHARTHARARALLITLWSQFLDTDDSGSLSSLEFRTGIKQLVTRASAPPASLCSIRMPAVAYKCRHNFAEIRQGCFFPGSADRAVLPSTRTRTIHSGSA